MKLLLCEAQKLISSARSGSIVEQCITMQPEPFMQFTLFRMVVQFEQWLKNEAGNAAHMLLCGPDLRMCARRFRLPRQHKIEITRN